MLPSAASPCPIVDTHQHLWDLSRLKLSWMNAAAPAVLRQSRRMPDYQQDVANSEIAATIYMEVDVVPEDQPRELEDILAICRDSQTPMKAAVVGGHPENERFAAWAERLAGEPEVRGTRRVLHVPETPTGYCLQSRFVENISRLGTLGLSFDLCMRPEELGDAVTLARRCSATEFIVDHCGNLPVAEARPETGSPRYPVWRKAMRELAMLPNVRCKFSGIVATTETEAWTPQDLRPLYEEVLGIFGPARLMFGSDWPVCTTRSSAARWIAAARELIADLPADDQRRILYDNAWKFYRLGSAGAGSADAGAVASAGGEAG